MKVLFVSSGNAEAGISPVVRNQGNSLKKAGIDISFFPLQGKGMKGYLRGFGGLRRYLRSNTFDIIHAHYGLSGNIALLARPRGTPLVVSYMGDDLLGGKNHTGRKTISGNMYVSFNNCQVRYFNDWTIVKSEEMLASIRKPRNCAVIPNGVSFDLFHPIEMNAARPALGIGMQEKIILFPADPSRSEKNFRLAQEAINLLESKYHDIRLLAVCKVEQSVLNMYYNAADVTVLTSFHEGSPNIIKEAMACNCPFVSTKVGDVDKVMGNTEGCYISTFNPSDFAGYIDEAIQFGRRTEGRESIQYLKDDAIAGRIIEIYNKISKN